MPFHGNFIWRVCGFPCETILQLALSELADEARGLVGELDFKKAPWPSRWRKARDLFAGRGWLARFGEAFDEKRRTLCSLSHDVSFRRAIACSAPSALVALGRLGMSSGPRRSEDKRRELLAHRFLQRFCTKCETSAFFGPVATGRICDQDDPIRYRFNVEDYTPSIFLGSRYLSLIIDELRRNPTVFRSLSVRRRTGVSIRDGAIVHAGLGCVPAGSIACTLLEAATGSTRVMDLLHGSDEENGGREQALRTLVQFGFLEDDLAGLWHAPDPLRKLETVIARVSGVAPQLLFLLDLLSDTLSRWGSAEADERLSLLAAVNRASAKAELSDLGKGGTFYGDHLPIVEDGMCASAELLIDEKWARPALDRIERALSERLSAGQTERKLRHQRAIHLLGLRSGQSLPLADFLQRLTAVSADPIFIDSSADLAGAVGPDAVNIVSPDMMMSASDIAGLSSTGASWILTECHSSIGIAGFFVRVMPQANAWLAGVAGFLERQLAGTRPLVLTASTANKTYFQGYLPGAMYLETGLGAPDSASLVTLDDLEVVANGGLQLLHRPSKTPLAVLPGPWNASPGLDCFRPPRCLPRPGGNSRVIENGICTERASWRGPKNDTPVQGAPAAEVFIWAQAVRHQLNLPRWVFAHSANEAKPIFLDLDNPFSCEELVRICRKDSNIRLVEMEPSPEGAWVKTPHGRHLCEMRWLYAGRPS